MTSHQALAAQLLQLEVRFVTAQRERDDVFCEWLEADPGTQAWDRGLRRLQKLDEQLEVLRARAHKLRCDVRGVRHLRVA